jgi:hypothetical protein
MRPISPSLGISFSEGAHFLLDGCGMIPLFGELCDAGNALWYLAEGDPLNAGVSVAGMIPIGGQAATGGRAAANVVDGVKSACSFDGGTEVMMADGTTKPIKDVEIGDRVLATDPETGEEGPRVVTRRWVHDDTLVDLELADGTVVTTTEDHPFWNATDRAWQRADRLDRGDDLHSATGQRIKVNGLAASTQKIAVAYNLTVDAIHTYYVLAGNTPVLVHNTGPCDVPTPNITQKGLDHSFDRHAEQWFGRPVTKTDKMGEWNALIERAAGSTKAVPWSSGSTLTNAHLARVDGKWFVAQFDRSNGQLVTAFVPNNGQVGAMLNLLGK